MKNYRLKRQYFPSRRIIVLFQVAFVIVLLGFVFQVAAVLFAPEGSVTFKTGPVATLLFVAMGFLVLVLLCANATLWLGMLHFLATYDGRTVGQKTFWAVVTLFGLSIGAALYYWFVYRIYIANIPLGQPRIQPA